MKYFCISDIHSFYSQMLKALEEAGYERDNQEHKIVLLGDAFDRGDESLQMYNWLLDMCQKDKIIYIKGNHEELLEQLLDKKYVESHDKHNRSDKTVYHLAGAKLIEHNIFFDQYDMMFEDACDKVRPMYEELKKYIVPYFELKDYIFVHSWIPTKAVVDEEKASRPEYKDVPKLWLPYKDAYDPDWREGSDWDWNEAAWGNPFKMASQGLNQTGKYIVSGHFHVSYYWSRHLFCTEFGDDAVWDIAIDEEHKHIGIDKCTAHTGEVNVLVVEE